MGGLHGVGVSVVNALSEWAEVTVAQKGKLYYQKYTRGTPTAKLKVIGKTEKTGTKTMFYPDSKIFEKIEFKFDVLSNRLRELAFLNKGVKIDIVDQRGTKNKQHSFQFNGGIISFVQHLIMEELSL